MDGAGKKLYGEDAAKAADLSFATWRRYCSEANGRRRIAPPADGEDYIKGHVRPWWWESTITEWRGSRLGRGKRRDLADRTAEPGPVVP